MSSITQKADVDLGVVPTHIKFVGGLVPDEAGKLPRDESGELTLIKEVEHLLATSPVAISSVQVPFFPGLNQSDCDELFAALKEAGVKPLLIMMVGGGDPMNPADEDSVCPVIVEGL